jgi:hypothetical protein
MHRGEKKNGGDRIRTCDLEVMSLASYLAAPPRVILVPGVLCQPGLSLLPDGKSACKVCFVFRHCCLDADQLK